MHIHSHNITGLFDWTSKYVYVSISIQTIFNILTNYKYQQIFLPLDPLKDPHVCGRPQCELENTKFNYASNIRYVYEYNSHIKSEFNGTGQNSSDIFVSGTVELIFPKKCEGTMKIVDVELRERPIEEEGLAEVESGESVQLDNLHSKSVEFASDVQKYDLR